MFFASQMCSLQWITSEPKEHMRCHHLWSTGPPSFTELGTLKALLSFVSGASFKPLQLERMFVMVINVVTGNVHKLTFQRGRLTILTFLPAVLSCEINLHIIMSSSNNIHPCYCKACCEKAVSSLRN